ncbi:MAG: hypothetical protein N3B11_02065 [Coriobacteriia bacterium]|nr:hypothetical protein [Coriobacteriia bacterium]
MRKRSVRVLWAICSVALLAALGGCVEAGEPLRLRGLAAVVVCSSLDARMLSDGTAPAAAALARRGGAAIVVRAVGDEPLRASSPGRDVRFVDAGDAAEDPAGVDAAIAQAAREAGGGTVVLVSQTGTTGLVVVTGAGVPEGLLSSRRTHRAGLLTATDVAEVVRALEDAKSGQQIALRVHPRRGAVSLLAALQAYAAAAAEAQAPIIVGFSVLAGVSVLGSWLLAGRAGTRYWQLVAYRALMLALSVPPATLAARLMDRYPASVPRVLALVLGGAGVLWVLATAVAERRGAATGLAALVATSCAAVVLDQVFGAPLAPGTAFSYAPLAGFRFYGIGNEGAAVALGSWLAAAALAMRSDRAARLGVLILGAVTVAVCSFPLAGANSLVALWGTVLVATFALAATRRSITARDAAGICLAAIAGLALVVVAERVTGAGTHVGTAIAAGRGPLGVVAGRLAAVVRAYAAHPAALAGFAAWGLLAYVWWRPPAPLKAAFTARPNVRAAATAALAGGLVAAVVEDSSVVVMVLLALYAGAAITGGVLDGMEGGW